MRSDKSELQGIAERLGRLEAQNRRLKWGAVTVIVFAAFSSIVLMGQTVPAPVSAPRVVEAQKFVLKDENGNVRGWMGTVGNGSELTLGNANAQPMIELIVSTDASDLHFFGSRKSGMNLGLNSGEPALSMIDGEGNADAGIEFAKEGPSLTLKDAKGSSAVVGTIQPKTLVGSHTHETSALSVILFDKNKKVIWQAP